MLTNIYLQFSDMLGDKRVILQSYSVSSYADTSVTYLDLDGEARRLEADGLLAVCVQHEIDHLDGKLFVDYLSRLKQDRLRKKAIKRQRDDIRL